MRVKVEGSGSNDKDPHETEGAKRQSGVNRGTKGKERKEGERRERA